MFLHIGVPCAHLLPLPLGEVAERSEVPPPCLSLWERWPSAARTGRVCSRTERPSQSPAVTALPERAKRGCFRRKCLPGMFLHICVPRDHPLPLPLGEVAERSEDGEGMQPHRKALSVTCGDSSPKGRAKSVFCSDSSPKGRVKSVICSDSSPKRRAKGAASAALYVGIKNGSYLY